MSNFDHFYKLSIAIIRKFGQNLQTKVAALILTLRNFPIYAIIFFVTQENYE